MKKIPFREPLIEQFYEGAESKEDLENSFAELEGKVDHKWKLSAVILFIFMVAGPIIYGWLFDNFFSETGGGTFLLIVFAHFAFSLLVFKYGLDILAFSCLTEKEQRLFKNISADLQKISDFEAAKENYDLLVTAFTSETSEFYWKRYKGIELEKKIAKMLQRVGYKVDFTPTVGDGGIDLQVYCDEKQINIQVKGHSKRLGVGAIRDAAGVLATEQLPMVVVAPRGFTSGAIEFADRSGVKLWDAYELTKIASQYLKN